MTRCQYFHDPKGSQRCCDLRLCGRFDPSVSLPLHDAGMQEEVCTWSENRSYRYILKYTSIRLRVNYLVNATAKRKVNKKIHMYKLITSQQHTIILLAEKQKNIWRLYLVPTIIETSRQVEQTSMKFWLSEYLIHVKTRPRLNDT